jgi:hypothetical protein
MAIDAMRENVELQAWRGGARLSYKRGAMRRNVAAKNRKIGVASGIDSGCQADVVNAAPLALDNMHNAQSASSLLSVVCQCAELAI